MTHRLSTLHPATLLAIAATTLTATPGHAQTFTEGFDNASNEGNWEVWWNNYNLIHGTGGNPDWFLELDNTSGPSTCHWVETFNTTWPCAYSGDYRALNVTSLGLDVDVRSGAYGGEWRLVLVSDNGTPGDDSDDCKLTHITGQVPPLAPGWTSYDFAIPSQETTLPPGWIPEGPCGITGHDIWNHVIQDVDQVRFVLDTDPTQFCVFFQWQMGVDNIRIVGGIGGENYCSVNANSTGSPAIMSAEGDASVGANDLTLHAQPVPDQPGLFFFGPSQIEVPFGNGFLCVGGGQIRILPPAVANGGIATRQVDLPTFGIGPGTLHFQYWMRDPAAGGAGFNTSDGLTITFLP